MFTRTLLVDDDGHIVATAFQDNVTLVKVYARLGCAIGMPSRAVPGEAQPQNPFVAAEWTGGNGGGGGGGGAGRAGDQSQGTDPTEPQRRGPGRPPKDRSESV